MEAVAAEYKVSLLTIFAVKTLAPNMRGDNSYTILQAPKELARWFEVYKVGILIAVCKRQNIEKL